MHQVKEAENSTSSDDNLAVGVAVYLLPCLMLKIGYLIVVDDYTLSPHHSLLVEPNQRSDHDRWQLRMIGSCYIHPVAENGWGPHREWDFEPCDEVGHAQDTCFRHFVGIRAGSIHDLEYALYFV